MAGSGAEQMRALGRDLRAAGESGKGLRKEFTKAIRATAVPVRTEVKNEALLTLPNEGSLNYWVYRGLRATMQFKFTGRSVGVRLVFKRPKQDGGGLADLNAINRGRLRRPTYGRAPWQTQTIQGGFVDRVLDGPVVERMRAEFLQAVDVVKRKIAAGG